MPNNPDYGNSIKNLAVTYERLNSLKQSHEKFYEEFKFIKSNIEPNDQEIRISINYLAIILEF